MGELKWSLLDSDLDIVGRLGMAGLAMSISAAAQDRHDLDPLRARYTSTEIILRWPSRVLDQAALSPLIRWAWQLRAGRGNDGDVGGVLYLPGVHRGSARDNVLSRLNEHSGVLSTFLQHPRTQPKSKPFELDHEIDGTRRTTRYVHAQGEVAFVRDFNKELFKCGRLRSDAITLSSYLCPGITARHGGEASWAGSAKQALPLFFAPIACFYFQIRGSDWVVVMPEPRDLEAFVQHRRLVDTGSLGVLAASASDAGFRVLAAMNAKPALRQMSRFGATTTECTVTRVGKVAWNRQNVRNRVARIHATDELLGQFLQVASTLPNKVEIGKDGVSGFDTVPAPRSIIIANLVAGQYWYHGLLQLPSDLRDQVERNRRLSESPERTWFRWLRRYRHELTQLAETLALPRGTNTVDADTIFRLAFNKALQRIYANEGSKAGRGSRTGSERIADRTEQIRRALTKAQTKSQIRDVIASLFAEGGRNQPLREHAETVWRFVDDERDYRRARDLALLCLAAYVPTEKGGGTEDDDDNTAGDP